MYRISRLLLVATAFVVMSVSMGHAQGLRTAYFMDNVPVRLKMNPAFQPMKGYFGIPVLGSLGAMISSNSLSISDFQDIMDDENGFLSQKFINNLEDDNTMTIDFNTDVLSFGFYAGRSFWSINVGARVIFNASIPKSMFEFARNSGNFEPGQNYEIEDFDVNATAYAEVGLGYSRKVNDRLYVGAKVKALLGAGNIDAQINRIHVYTEGDATDWSVEADGVLEASMKGLEFVNDEGTPYINDVDLDSFGISGFGFGFDLGASYEVIDNLHLSAAILDLGFISWSKSSTRVAKTPETIFNYNTLAGELGNINPDDYQDLTDEEIQDMIDDYVPDYSNTDEDWVPENASDILDYDLFRFTEEEEVSGRTTSLVSTLNIGAEYTFWENRFGIGLLSSTQFVSPKSYSELTVSANFRPGNAFGATLSYSFLRGKTIGLGIKLGNFFIGTDYMMAKSFDDAQRLNAYLGVTLGFGKKHNK